MEGESLVDMIREDLVAERVAIDSHGEMIRYLGDDDPTTRRMLEGILAMEEEHAEDLARGARQICEMTSPSASGTADVLSMELREPRVFRPGGCALASYSGTFVGVIGPPIETGTIAAVNAGPNPTPPRWSDAPAA